MLKSIGVVGVVVLIVAAICIVPFVAIWTVNSIAIAGGSEFYLEHSVFNYFLALLCLALVRGGK